MTTNYIEPGNILAQAHDLGMLEDFFRITEWVGLSDTKDLYKFTTHQSAYIHFQLAGLSKNVNIQLLDSNGNVISGSYRPGIQDEWGDFPKLKAGDYYVKVYSNSPGTNYELGLGLRRHDAGSSPITAQNLGVISEQKHIIGRLHSLDTKDVYRFTTHQPGDLDFSLTGLYKNANIQLLDSNENLISGSYNPGRQDEFNTYENLAAGDYYFKVYSNGSGTDYKLDFNLRPDDAGNSFGQAQNIGFVLEDKHLAGRVGSTDTRDFYRFSTEQVGYVNFSLSELSQNANIQLFDSNENLISGSYNPGTQDESSTYENLAPGDYYFKVYSNSSGTNYQLDFEFLPNSSAINGTNGNDLLEGIKIGDLIQGLDGNDTIIGNDGDDSLYGGAGNDSIRGNSGDNILYGQNGDDSLYGQYGNDTLNGGAGNDSLHGIAGNDLLIAGEGDDKLFGHSGDDTLKSSGGRNYFYGGTGNDLLLGGRDRDSIRSGPGNDTVYGYGSQDHLSGWYGDDKIYGGDDHDQMYGDWGDDFLAGENGIDFLFGGEGRDRLYGGDDRDYLKGEEGNDVLSGDRGNDKLRGGDNNDVLIGGTGNDTLSGGSGNDIFLYNTEAAFNRNVVGLDTIEDFGDDRDRIYLDKTTFTAISSQAGYGFSKTNEFAAVNNDSQVAVSNARIVFSKGTGNLFYNQNGAASGLGSGGHFATLTDVNILRASDFIIHD